MKREIKFRAWILYPSNDQSPYMYQWCDNFFSDMTEVTKWGDEFPKDENEVILMQYTGLKDKNGKEIYEGDIFKPFSQGIRYYALYFENGCFKLKSNLGTWGTIERFFELAPKYGCDVEVIGNIYENENLIKS